MTPQERARRSAEVMWARDAASQEMGMRIEDVGPGTATLSMTVEPRHANGHDICHGGYIFALADSAFAFACNSYNKLAVAQHNTITYLRPVRVGARMTAVAREVSLAGRTGVYDVAVEADGKVAAQFRGVSRVVEGEHFAEGEE
ncbi:hydroxyphenylacetyl-CoA thioesterase PaaI [Oceanicella actignis]|uniref:Acyl-CoA thioesterase n=1 Tax=Oceanicella actignis TaxID=1189325 RepID=A0A1M7TKN8_9RHOB|nr:hydroxyphenylacetyl-CoA thioesterase PaaI [Oceanicella actignis]TYO88233.1 acyl-CoA thioesterase [Oceanicella actignis]SET68109.1 acyl-CoA thioesterase [Oceanicella actignis]SHN71183.1 acyl-CoA thioesterase [Oceanicella actignis]